jgi:hypothetical protein
MASLILTHSEAQSGQHAAPGNMHCSIVPRTKTLEIIALLRLQNPVAGPSVTYRQHCRARWREGRTVTPVRADLESRKLRRGRRSQLEVVA